MPWAWALPLICKVPLSFLLALLVPHLRCGVVRFKLNSSPCPELFSSPGRLLETSWGAQPQPWGAQPRDSLKCPTQRLLECLECPTPKSRWSGQRVSLKFQRVSLECPTPESPWSANPQRLSGVPNGANSSCKHILRICALSF